MIITSSRNTPVSSGVSDTIDYKIDVSNLGHIASILRKAYSDPIRAVVREYGTNACEGHILNGKTKTPIQVVLPTGMKPVFTIRDFGPGLGREKFQELFCSYGGSDKRASNAFTGCLGIGCKSYGAYTDAVTVTDYHGVTPHKDGVKYIWNCHIDESEVGKASLLSDDKTNQPTGVEISIPVRPQDIMRFRSTAIQVYRVFDVRPDILNLTAEEKKEYAVQKYRDGIVKGTNWSFNGEGESWLQMGLVLYPLKSDFSGSPVIKQLIDAGVYVRVELGDVQVAPSREDLQYSQKTIQGLIKNLNPVIDSMGSTLLTDIQSAPDYFQAHMILRKFTGNGGYSSSSFREGIVKKLKGKLKWKTFDMYDDNRIPLCVSTLKKDQTEIELLKSHGITAMSISKRSWGKAKFNVDRAVDELIVNKDSVVMINDTGTGSGEARVRHWLLNSGPAGATVTIINYKNGGREFLNKTLPWFATTTFQQVSTLPTPPPKQKGVDADGVEVEYDKNVKHTKGNVFALYAKYQRQDKRSDYWGISAAPTTGKKVYVILDQFKWSMPGKDYDMEEYYPLYRAKEYLKTIGYCDQIYGVKEADVAKKVDATWTKLQDAIEQGTQAFLKANPDKAQKIADRYAVLSFFNSRATYHTDRLKKEGCFFERSSFDRWANPKTGPLKDIKSDSPFRIFMDKILDMVGGQLEQGDKDLPAWLEEPRNNWALGRSNNDDKKGVYQQLKALLPKPSYDLKAEGTKIASRYPLLRHNNWQTDVMEYATEGTVEYVHLVDAARKTK
jgi:hypothetical protein